MNEATFKAIGTIWRITSSGADFRKKDIADVRSWIADFENRFSRFLPDSEVNAFRDAHTGIYSISDEFALLLKKADELRSLTGGVYDPAAGALLERAGYDAHYSLTPQENINDFSLPQWSLKGTSLYLSGPTIFDLGGIGKGYAIDRVSDLLTEKKYMHFCVEAGGDMYVTAKKDCSPWNTAIQYPGKPDIAAGVVRIKNQALAVSDTSLRRWKNWHHIVNPHKKESVREIVGAAALAPSAWHADCMTSALFLAPPASYTQIAQKFDASYLVFYENGSCTKSVNWIGEIFM